MPPPPSSSGTVALLVHGGLRVGGPRHKAPAGPSGLPTALCSAATVPHEAPSGVRTAGLRDFSCAAGCRALARAPLRCLSGAKGEGLPGRTAQALPLRRARAPGEHHRYRRRRLLALLGHGGAAVLRGAVRPLQPPFSARVSPATSQCGVHSAHCLACPVLTGPPIGLTHGVVSARLSPEERGRVSVRRVPCARHRVVLYKGPGRGRLWPAAVVLCLPAPRRALPRRAGALQSAMPHGYLAVLAVGQLGEGGLKFCGRLAASVRRHASCRLQKLCGNDKLRIRTCEQPVGASSASSAISAPAPTLPLGTLMGAWPSGPLHFPPKAWPK